MYHSITFRKVYDTDETTLVDTSYRDYNTWDDWKLIPKERPVVDPPSLSFQQNVFPDNQPISFSTADFYKATPYARQASWTFIIDNDYSEYDQPTVFNSIMNALHGQLMKIYLEDDPDYYYYGQVTVGKWSPQNNFSEITIEVACEALKYGEVKEVRFNKGPTYTLDVDTDWMCPCIVILKPFTTFTNFTLSGFANSLKIVGNTDIVLSQLPLLPNEYPFVINGVTKKLYRNGVDDNQFGKVKQMWQFPMLASGTNTITASANSTISNFLTVTFRYQERRF